MPQAETTPAEILVLRAWVEGHSFPLRVRILRVERNGAQTSSVVARREDALEVIADWLEELSSSASSRPTTTKVGRTDAEP